MRLSLRRSLNHPSQNNISSHPFDISFLLHLMKAFKFEENDIVVTIPFNREGQVGNNVGDKVGNNQNALNQTRQTILSEMRNNPIITKAELSRILGISTTAIDNNISFLKKNGYIERIGSKKTGYWSVKG